ncbi:hypothetical protein FACS1894187_18790 [Synergistales bacterium]|nr:hypothetical protein FACS1894187_18790 [Synergistales bacterium]
MFVQFLVEDQSGEKLIDAVMNKYNLERPDSLIEYEIRSYKGIGGFKKGPNAKNIKSDKLLTDLPKRMRAFDSILRSMISELLCNCLIKSQTIYRLCTKTIVLERGKSSPEV